MPSVKWELGAVSTVLTTELNSLADDANAISAELDNTGASNGWLFDDVEWHHETLGYTPSTGAVIELYIIQRELDGTGYEDGDASIDPPSSNLVGVFNIRASTSAQTHILRQIPIPPDRFKYLVINKTGGTMPSSNNTLKRTPYRYQTG